VFATNFFQPVTDTMLGVLKFIHAWVPSYGLDMILLALVVRGALFPLAQQQFKSMAQMQKLQPLMKKLQAEYKGKPQELQAATMALYKEHGANPLAGCLPMLVQLPILLGLFYAIQSQIKEFQASHFLWMQTGMDQFTHGVLAANLGQMDFLLLVLYVVSMYLSVRYGSPPSSDPQQAQTQKIMAIMSPAMIAFFGWKYHWASALLIYWLTLNVLTMAQQFYMYRRVGLIGAKKAVEVVEPPPLAGNKTSNRAAIAGGKNGSTSGRASRRSKR